MFFIPGIKEECDMSMIRVENLTFAYPSSYDNIFENVNFQIDTDSSGYRIAKPAEPVNGQDERRISCAAVDSPARLC